MTKLIEGEGRVIAAKNIRIELKTAFPGVKFSVTSESFSGGNAVDIRWEGWPSCDEVEKITKKYQHGYFDGMTDSYTYEKAGKYGSAQYVQAFNYDAYKPVVQEVA